MTTELEQATVLADRVLNRINADPDDDLAVLARQLLRALERERMVYPMTPATDHKSETDAYEAAAKIAEAYGAEAEAAMARLPDNSRRSELWAQEAFAAMHIANRIRAFAPPPALERPAPEEQI